MNSLELGPVRNSNARVLHSLSVWIFFANYETLFSILQLCPSALQPAAQTYCFVHIILDPQHITAEENVDWTGRVTCFGFYSVRARIAMYTYTSDVRYMLWVRLLIRRCTSFPKFHARFCRDLLDESAKRLCNNPEKWFAARFRAKVFAVSFGTSSVHV